MTTLYLVRHVQAEANLRRLFHGQTDGQVTELGLKQAERLRARFADIPLDAAMSSDLSRALTTAKSIVDAHEGLPLLVTPALREICAGAWEGLSIDEIERTYPDDFAGFMRVDRDARLGGGESIGEVAARLTAAADVFVRSHPGQTLLLVSHGCALTSFLSSLNGSPVKLGTNASVSRVDYDDAFRPTVAYIGDASHLEGVRSPALLPLGGEQP